MKRPWGFREFTKRQGFHSIYLVTTEAERPVKIGMAVDPRHRFLCLQSAHFEVLRLHRYWWVAGRPISKRIEQGFKERFAAHLVRGEWFDLPLIEAETFVEDAVANLNTWGALEMDVIELLDHRARQRQPFGPDDGPTPLRGMPHDWQHRGARRARPLLPKSGPSLRVGVDSGQARASRVRSFDLHQGR